MKKVNDEFIAQWAIPMDDGLESHDVRLTIEGLRNLESMAQELLLSRKVVEAIRNYQMDFRPISEALSALDQIEDS